MRLHSGLNALRASGPEKGPTVNPLIPGTCGEHSVYQVAGPYEADATKCRFGNRGLVRRFSGWWLEVPYAPGVVSFAACLWGLVVALQPAQRSRTNVEAVSCWLRCHASIQHGCAERLA